MVTSQLVVLRVGSDVLLKGIITGPQPLSWHLFFVPKVPKEPSDILKLG
jgi:hypothetical protein